MGTDKQYSFLHCYFAINFEPISEPIYNSITVKKNIIEKQKIPASNPFIKDNLEGVSSLIFSASSENPVSVPPVCSTARIRRRATASPPALPEGGSHCGP